MEQLNNKVTQGPGSRIRQHRFFILLGALTLMLACSPLVGQKQLGSELRAELLFTILYTGVLLSAVFAVSKYRITKLISLGIAIPLAVLNGANSWLQEDAIAIADHILSILFLLFVIILILRAIFMQDSVTADTICAALCVYILIGILFSIVFSLVEIFDPTAFVLNISAAGERASMRFGGERSIFAIYYSFVTLTTLGYGDIAPASSPARMLAVVEAMVGQLYLAVLIARLVGLHIAHAAATRHTHRND